MAHEDPDYQLLFTFSFTTEVLHGQDASTASTDATARPEEDENQDFEAVNSGMRPLRFGGRYK